MQRPTPSSCSLAGIFMGGPRYIWWNFVSSRPERIEQAKEEWARGRFDTVPGDMEEFIPSAQTHGEASARYRRGFLPLAARRLAGWTSACRSREPRAHGRLSSADCAPASLRNIATASRQPASAGPRRVVLPVLRHVERSRPEKVLGPAPSCHRAARRSSAVSSMRCLVSSAGF